MSNYTLIILTEAEQEFVVAYDWYEKKQRGLGEKFFQALDVCFKRIDNNPNTFQIVYKEFRQAIVPRFPYVVIYEQVQNKIIVYAIFHTSRNPYKKFR